MNEFTNGQLIELCQMVYRGAKPCAMMSLLERDRSTAKKIVIKEKCRYMIEPLDNDWNVLWIYLRDELIEVINCLPKEPSSPADHYLLGALFGYSNDAICDFISKLNL